MEQGGCTVEEMNCRVPKIIFGIGKTGQLPEFVQEFGKKAFLAIDPYVDKTGLADEVMNNLKKISVDTVKWTDIEPNPSCLGVDKAAEIAKREGSEVVIAIGGGSTMDFGKGVAVMATHPGICWQYTERTDHEVLRPTSATLPVITIPTTSGTGSEATAYAVFNNPEIKEKSTLINDFIIPKLALVDPELTFTAPPLLTAHTGIDALAHAIESYIALSANSFSKMVSREAIRLVATYLPVAVANGKNVEAREKMSWASTLGGIGIAHGGVALPHAIGQPVSGVFGAPHGGSITACLGRVIEISFPSDLQGFAEIAEALDPSVRDLPLRARAEKCSELVERLFQDTNSKARYADYGMTEADIDKVTHIALTGYAIDIAANPRQVTEEEIKQIYRDCI